MKTPHLNTVYRKADENDVPGIRLAIRSSIEGLAAKDYSRDILENWGANTESAGEKQRTAIREGRELTWVADQNGKIVGFSALSPQSGELRAVYVASEVARSGVGTKLLELVESEAKRLGLDALSMHSSLTAVPFYERHGYCAKGEQIHTLSTGVKMKSVSMEKSLV